MNDQNLTYEEVVEGYEEVEEEAVEAPKNKAIPAIALGILSMTTLMYPLSYILTNFIPIPFFNYILGIVLSVISKSKAKKVLKEENDAVTTGFASLAKVFGTFGFWMNLVALIVDILAIIGLILFFVLYFGLLFAVAILASGAL